VTAPSDRTVTPSDTTWFSNLSPGEDHRPARVTPAVDPAASEPWHAVRGIHVDPSVGWDKASMLSTGVLDAAASDT
jgi:hypothetical protein